MKINLSNDAELMGIFGLSWPEKVASFMAKRLKGSALESKIKSFWGGSGKNTTLVNNLETQYLALLASGYNPVTFSLAPDASGNGGVISPDGNLLIQNIYNTTGVDKELINEFLRALFVLARDGKIPYEKWNPKSYNDAKSLTANTFTSEQGLIQKLAPTGKTFNNLILIAGIGVGAYLLSQLKGFIK